MTDTLVYTEDIGRVRFRELAGCCVHILCLAGHMEFGYAGRRFSVESDDAAIIGSPLLVADLAVSPDFRSLAFVASHRFLEA